MRTNELYLIFLRRATFLLTTSLAGSDNRGMNTDFQTLDQVKTLIDAAGGPSALATMMGFDREGGRQRVANWTANGRIPVMVVRAYRPLFRKIMRKAAAQAAGVEK